MAGKDIDQMISAYAAGCLDKNNYIRFKKYLEEEGDLPAGELGEQQNIMSLFPTLLELEKPDKKFKSHLAKKIIEIQKKIKTKKTFSGEDSSSVRAKDDSDVQKLKRQPLHSAEGPKQSSSAPAPQKENKYFNRESSSKITIIFTGSVLLILVLVTFYFMKINSELEEDIINIKNQLTGFQNEIANTNEYLNEHIALIEFFNYKDVEIANLSSTNVSEGAWGKLLISFDAGEGLIQLKNLPPLEIDEAYQLWMVSKDVGYPLATIILREDLKYYKITNIPYIPKEEVDLFRITKEKRSGSKTPQGTTYLYGILNLVSE